MDVNEFTNPVAAANNPLAVLLYVCTMCVAGVVVNKTARLGWRGTRWAASRTRAAFRPAVYSPQAMAVVAMLEEAFGDTEVWSTNDLPESTRRQLPTKLEVSVRRAKSYAEANVVKVGTSDVLFGLPKGERKAVYRKALALLDALTQNDAIAKVSSGKLNPRATTVPTANRYVDPTPNPVNVEGTDLFKVASRIRVSVAGYKGSMVGLLGNPKAGSLEAGGYDAYVQVKTTEGVFVVVQVGRKLSEAERREVTGSDVAGGPVSFAFVPTGFTPKVG